MNKYLILLEVLKKGYQLKNVETWKKVGLATSLVTAVLSGSIAFATTMGWLTIEVPAEVISAGAGAIVSVVGAVLSYLQVATTEKIGFDGKKEPELLEESEETIEEA